MARKARSIKAVAHRMPEFKASETVLIPPEQAQKYLEASESAGFTNRSIRQVTVDRYGYLMKLGKWDPHSSVIIVDTNGVLVNGYHRMWAAFEHGVAFETVLVVTPDRALTFRNVDTGKVRDGSDVLAIAGYSHVTSMASAVRLFLRHRHGSHATDNQHIVTNDDILTFVDRNKTKVNRAVAAAVAAGARKVAGGGGGLAFIHLLIKDKDAADEFAFQLCHGYDSDELGLPASSPVFHLRERLTAAKVAIKIQRMSDQLNQRQALYLMAKAYQQWAAGRKVRKIQLPKVNLAGGQKSLVDAYRIPKEL